MTKYATKLPDGQKYQRFNGTLKVMSTENPFLYNVRVEMLNSKTNSNDWRYEKLADNIPDYETPILIAYPNGKIGDGHNFKVKADPKTGEDYASFTDANSERIVGWFSPNEIRVETINGEDWLVGTGKIWTYYNKELTDMLTAQGGSGMEVSIETLVKDIRMDGTTEVYDSYHIIGTTILGKGVTPAVAGARIRALADLGNQLKELQLRVASYKETETKKDPEPTDKNVGADFNKGVNHKMSNKKLTAKMQKLFPDYRVLSVSEDGLTVGLYNPKDNEFSAYVFTKEEPDLVTETRFQSANASVHVYVSKDYSYEVPVEELMDNKLPEQVKALEAEKAKETEARENAEKEKEAVETELKAMRDKETVRRKNAAKEAVKNALKKWNDVHPEGERVNESELTAINEDIDNGAYDKENADGEWCGDKNAVAALNAVCADASTKYHEKQNSANRTVYAWDKLNGSMSAQDNNELADVLRRNGVDA